MLSLVVFLHWWYHRLDTPSSDWLSALRDVSWVLSELVKDNRPHHRSKKRALEVSDGEEEPLSRRLRSRQQKSNLYLFLNMNTSPISISDDEDTESSLTLTSFPDSADLQRTFRSTTMCPAQVERPVCTPPVYESSAPTRKSGRGFRYYVVFVGDHPGCYRNWADASARVTNYPGNMHKGYDTYDQALAGWRQHCLASHIHPPGFVDGSMFVAPAVPTTPPPLTPPPSKTNMTSFPATLFSPDDSPIRTPSQIHPSTFPSLEVVSPVPIRTPTSQIRPSTVEVSPVPTSVPPRVDVDAQTPQRRNRFWAIHSPRFNSVVPSSTQADKILMRAMEQGEEVEVREVDGVAQAEQWFGSLTLDD
ncbi:hypothetical protein EV361DRAFT_955516 [Lentinula raphanica]|nr:hypothetical protein EV361DRAFT_955516 [Lentinula raphanica]